MKPKKHKPVDLTGMPRVIAGNDHWNDAGIPKTSVLKKILNRPRIDIRDLDSLQLIPGRWGNLAINWGADDLWGPKHKRFPVMLFCPDMKDMNDHHHIALTRKQAKALRNWLTRFLAKTKRKGK